MQNHDLVGRREDDASRSHSHGSLHVISRTWSANFRRDCSVFCVYAWWTRAKGKSRPVKRDMASEEAALPREHLEDRAFAKYGLPSRENTTVSWPAARSIYRLSSPLIFFYTFHRTNLIVSSVFAAYFDCEILHLAFV